MREDLRACNPERRSRCTVPKDMGQAVCASRKSPMRQSVLEFCRSRELRFAGRTPQARALFASSLHPGGMPPVAPGIKHAPRRVCQQPRHPRNSFCYPNTSCALNSFCECCFCEQRKRKHRRNAGNGIRTCFSEQDSPGSNAALGRQASGSACWKTANRFRSPRLLRDPVRLSRSGTAETSGRSCPTSFTGMSFRFPSRLGPRP